MLFALEPFPSLREQVFKLYVAQAGPLFAAATLLITRFQLSFTSSFWPDLQALHAACTRSADVELPLLPRPRIRVVTSWTPHASTVLAAPARSDIEVKLKELQLALTKEYIQHESIGLSLLTWIGCLSAPWRGCATVIGFIIVLYVCSGHHKCGTNMCYNTC